MISDNGARLQENMRVNPAITRARSFNTVLSGVVLAVSFRDTNKARQTLVDVALHDGYPHIYNVPVTTTKFNQGNGEEWSPEPSDVVLVTFIDGRWIRPIVIGQLYLPQTDDETAIQTTAAKTPDRKRRYHLRCNKTDIEIDKDGNRATTVEKNDTRHVKVDEGLTVDGKRTTVIEGNDELTINSGDYTIDVKNGKCTVHVKGKTAWTSDDTIELDGGSGSVKGIVQGDCICPFIKAPHIQVSATVKGSK